jgi:serine/threonine-protein kinase RsbW
VAAARLSLTSDPEQLAALRAWLRAALGGHGLTPDACAALVVAVGEVCTNAIRHAYAGAPGQPIHVSVERERDEVIVQVEHQGASLDPRRLEHARLGAPAEHGYGLYLIRTLTDRVSLEVGPPHRSRWRLAKTCRRWPDAGVRP